MFDDENANNEETEQQLDVSKLFGFKQIMMVCENNEKNRLHDDAVRLLNKIGTEVPPLPPGLNLI